MMRTLPGELPIRRVLPTPGSPNTQTLANRDSETPLMSLGRLTAGRSGCPSSSARGLRPTSGARGPAALAAGPALHALSQAVGARPSGYTGPPERGLRRPRTGSGSRFLRTSALLPLVPLRQLVSRVGVPVG